MALKRMDNVGIVLDDLEVTIDFFRELGLEFEGRATIEGEWADVSPDWAISVSRLPCCAGLVGDDSVTAAAIQGALT